MIRAFAYVKTSNLKSMKGKELVVKVNDEKGRNVVLSEEKEKETTDSVVAAKEEQKEDIKEIVTMTEKVDETVLQKPSPVAVETKAPDDEVLESILAVTTFHNLESAIKPLKDAGLIVDYGKYTTMKEPDSCYLIIYDRQATIKAVLGKGTTERKNLKTGNADSEKNYPGCGAIWFKVKQ